MKGCRKYTAVMLLAVLIFAGLSGKSEVMAGKGPKYRPYIKERSLSLTEGESGKLTIKYGEEYKIKYKSADKSIAKVSKNGKITGVKAGQTQILVIFSFAGLGSCDYRIPVRVWKKPFSEVTQTHTIENGMQCQVWISSNRSEGETTYVEIKINSDSEDEDLKLHVFGFEEDLEAFCPRMDRFIEVDKGYINTKTREKTTGGTLFLQSPLKAAWINNDTGAPVEVTITVKTFKGEKTLRYFELEDVKAGK